MKSIYFSLAFIVFAIFAYGENEPNNSQVQANTMVYNTTQTGNLSGSDNEDWYLINLPQGGVYSITIKKTGTGNGTLNLYDGEKTGNPQVNYIGLSYGSSPTEGWILTSPLLAGKYYLKVAKNSGEINYEISGTLALPAFKEDEETNDTITKALNVQAGETINGTLHYYDPGKGKDEKDWYKMEIKTAGILKLKLHKKGSGSTTMYFRDDNMVPGKMLSNFFLSYGDWPAEGYSWNFAVLAGTYWILLEGGDGVVDYQFETVLEQPAFTSDQEPNDTITRALNVQAGGTINGTLHYYAPEKGKDEKDWYKMEIKTAGILKMKLHKKGSGSTTMYFRDENMVPGKMLSNFFLSYGNSPAEGYSWNFAVLAGTYWILLEGGDGVVDYQFETVLEQPAFTSDQEPNDTIIKALNVQAGGTINGMLHYYAPGKGKDEKDWYKMEIKTAGILKMKLNKKGAGNTTMYFRDENIVPGKMLSNFYLPYGESPAEGYSWNFAVLAGTYWFLINGGDGVVDYQLVSSLDTPAWPEDKESNDSIRLASEFSLKDSVSGVLYYYKPGIEFDLNDYYKIVTPDFGHLSIQISKKGIYGSAKLTDNVKDIISQGFAYGDGDYVISKLLPGGTYYLVFQHSSNWLQYKAAMKFTPKPTADFSFLNDGYSIAFDNTSGFGETFSWNFDDGTRSTQVNPYHNFSKPGEYDICLIANNVAGKDTACKRFTIPGVERYFPNEGGNTGNVTVEVHGGGLDTSFIGYLKQGSETIARSENTFYAGKGVIKLTFNLLEKSEGIYDLKLEKTGGPSYLFSGGFKIVTGTKSDPWVSISGRNRMLFNTWTTYSVSYGNTGNVDAIMTPVWLVFSNKPGLDVKFTGLEFANPFPEDSLPAEDLAIEQDIIFGVPKQVKVYSIIIPSIPAKTTNSFTIKIKSGEDVEVMVWNGKPLYQSPFNPLIGQCITQSQKWLDEKEFMVPEDDLECFLMLFQNYFNYVRTMTIKVYASYGRENETNRIIVGSFKRALNRALRECRIDSRDKETVKALLFALWLNNNIINPPHLKKSAEIDTSQVDCYSEFTPNHLQTTTIRTVSSLDPNEKTGLYGFGPDNFAAGAKDLSYTVFFENLATATAPAHTISITDQLDKNKFNLSSFSFGNIRVGDSLLYIQPGQKSFVVNKLFVNRNTVARITGEIDTITGKVEWKFRSLDPITLADTEDPDVGLLPPNLVSPRGEGNVSFSVGLKKNPVHGEIVTNEAAIVFDSNPAIQTMHKITFDINAPESKVLPLATSTTSNEFDVNWSGIDQGSGMQTYNIFVSANDEPYMLWMGGTTQTSAKFKSSSDNVYKFISVASDNVGNREIVPEVADAEISVVTDVFNPETGNDEFQVFPVPAKNELFFRIPVDGNFRITVYAGDGKHVFEKQIFNQGLHKIDIRNLKQGLYLWNITDEKNSVRKSGKFVK